MASEERTQPRGLIIFDADDTLWSTAPLYQAARDACRARVAECGIDPSEWLEAQIARDSELVPIMHFDRRQFPQACADAYETVARRHGLAPDAAVAARLFALADEVFTAPAPLKADVEQTLRLLARDHDLVLLTKGERDVQAQRILTSGLGRFFSEIVIVADSKTPDVFASICRGHGVAARDAWSVGNSLPSDINPALSIGMRAAWIDADVWQYERRETAPLPGTCLRTTLLRRLPRAIASVEREARRPAADREGVA